jgi:hypothetical protein
MVQGIKVQRIPQHYARFGTSAVLIAVCWNLVHLAHKRRDSLRVIPYTHQ